MGKIPEHSKDIDRNDWVKIDGFGDGLVGGLKFRVEMVSDKSIGIRVGAGIGRSKLEFIPRSQIEVLSLTPRDEEYQGDTYEIRIPDWLFKKKFRGDTQSQ